MLKTGDSLHGQVAQSSRAHQGVAVAGRTCHSSMRTTTPAFGWESIAQIPPSPTAKANPAVVSVEDTTLFVAGSIWRIRPLATLDPSSWVVTSPAATHMLPSSAAIEARDVLV